MNKQYDAGLIKRILNQYHTGQSVALLCAEHGISRSTIYFWIKQHQTLKSTTNTELSYGDYYDLKRKCFKVKDKYYYVCVILDLFSRKVIAHGISAKHSTYLITSTIKRALNVRNHPQQLTFPSDQGVQYT